MSHSYWQRGRSDGTYRFQTVRLGTYTVEAYEGGSRLRARATGLTLTQNGDVVERDLVFQALGTVHGQVRRPAGTPVPGLVVSVRSTNPVLGRLVTVTTDASGTYTVSDVPAGVFTATASITAERLFGEVSGQIDTEGQVVAADIGLSDTAIALPVTRRDVNGFNFDVQPNGSIGNGFNGVYGGDFGANRGGLLLELASPTAVAQFGGSTAAQTEESGREIVIRQQGLLSLDVTRKVYVPRDGYFARYLEVLDNPTAAAITVDVRVVINARVLNGTPRVLLTSSGDAVLDVASPEAADRWVVVDDDDDRDTQTTFTLPSLAFIFDGPGAADRARAAGFTAAVGGPGQLAYQWTQVTVPAGGRVAFMHVAVQQFTRIGSQASVERLAQVPPELLAGLGAEELAAVRNFVLPADGTGTVAPLPRLDGTVVGEIVAGDGTTRVHGSARFKSVLPIFGRTYFASVDASGVFRFQSSFSDTVASSPIPVADFRLDVFTGITGLDQQGVPAAFPAGEIVASPTILLTGTGVTRGVVRRANGALATGGSIRVAPTGESNAIGFVAIGSDGTYVGALPPGSYDLTAFLQSGLTGKATVSVAAAQTTTADITIQPGGRVVGTVRTGSGAPVPGILVVLFGPEFNRQAFTSPSGGFVYEEAPAGTLTLLASNLQTGRSVSTTITVLADQTTTADLAFPAVGIVQVEVRLADGRPAVGSQVQFSQSLPSRFDFRSGTSDAAGRLSFPNVEAGSFLITAYHPDHPFAIGVGLTGQLTTEGEIVTITAILPPVGTVVGQVTHPDGTPAPGAGVTILGAVAFRFGTTDVNGRYSIRGVGVRPGETFRVRATHPTLSDVFTEVGGQTLTAEGQTVVVDVRLPALATVRVTVLRADSTPFAGAFVSIQDRRGLRFGGQTDVAGLVDIPNVPEGPFTLSAHSDGRFIGSATGVVTAADHGRMVAVTVQQPPLSTVQGAVVAGDGQTPVNAAFLQVFDVAAGAVIGQAQTSSDGRYTILDVAVGQSGVLVRAHAPTDFGVVAEGTGTASSPGAAVTVDLALPISVAKGTVFYADGVSPVASPSVVARYRDPSGVIRTVHGNTFGPEGRYSVVGIPIGDFTLVAQDASTGLTGTVSAAVVAIATPVVLDVAVQPSGTVTGLVLDQANNAVPFAQVAVTSAGAPFNRIGTADAQGAFRFDRVALGAFTFQAKDPTTLRTASATGSLAADGATVTLNVNLPPTGTVTGVVRDAVGTAVSGANVTAENYGNAGSLGVFAVGGLSDASGAFQFTGVPSGIARAAAVVSGGKSLPGQPSPPPRVGYTEGVLDAGATVDLSVTLDTAVALGAPLQLTGADGFEYDINCRGEVESGGAAGSPFSSAFRRGLLLRVNGPIPPCFRHARTEDAGRELVIGPAGLGGLRITRKVFVPAVGGFARYLDTLENVSGAPVSATVEILSFLASADETRVLVSPAATGNTYAITGVGFCCGVPIVGHVFAGPASRIALSVTRFEDAETIAFYRWQVSLAPGKRATFMHFAIQRPFADLPGAQAQAEALVTLSDPNALSGMTPEERAQVVNFNVP